MDPQSLQDRLDGLRTKLEAINTDFPGTGHYLYLQQHETQHQLEPHNTNLRARIDAVVEECIAVMNSHQLKEEEGNEPIADLLREVFTPDSPILGGTISTAFHVRQRPEIEAPSVWLREHFPETAAKIDGVQAEMREWDAHVSEAQREGAREYERLVEEEKVLRAKKATKGGEVNVKGGREGGDESGKGAAGEGVGEDQMEIDEVSLAEAGGVEATKDGSEKIVRAETSQLPLR